LASKDKILLSAQKSLEKGQIAKAIKDYEQIVQIDPRDMRLRQKLAELYGRQNMSKEAFGALQVVARSYTDTGFYLKAIAVYKQMLKLQPEQLELFEQLAELNQKQGLTGNALTEYRSLVLLLEKAKRFDDAVAILQKMKKLEPENVSIRSKIVGFHSKSGHSAEARQEFGEMLELLTEQKDTAALLQLQEHFRSLLQQEPWLGNDLARALLSLDAFEKALGLLRSLPKKNENNPETLVTLADVYRRAGNFEQERLTCQHLLTVVPADSSFKERYLRACLDAQDLDRARESFAKWQDELKGACQPGVFEGLRARVLGAPSTPSPQQEKSAACAHIEPQRPLPSASPPVLPIEEDLEDLEDIEELEEFEPDTAYEEKEAVAPSPEFVAIEEDLDIEFDIDLELPAELDFDLDNADHTEALELLVETDDQGSPNSRPLTDQRLDHGIEADAEPGASPWDSLQGFLDEAEFFLQQKMYNEAEQSCLRLMQLAPGYQPALQMFVTIAQARQQATALTRPSADQENAALASKLGLNDSAGPASALPGSNRGAKEITAADPLTEEFSSFALDSLATELDLVLHSDLPGNGAAPKSPDVPGTFPSATDSLQSELEEAEFYLQQELFDEAEGVCLRILRSAPDCLPAIKMMSTIAARQQGRPGKLAAVQAKAAPASQVPATDSRSPQFSVSPFGGLDLLAAGGAETSSISQEDSESHFNLGIAYKEMGLLDDAVAEFNKAMRHPARLVDSLTLKGVCLAETGAMEKAEESFQVGLQHATLSDMEKVCLHYELGLLYERWGRTAEALEVFRQVADGDQTFRDVQKKLVLLRQALGLDEIDIRRRSGRDRVSFV
jgi:tetratricopeptide (TPR) repeat protein